MFKRYIIVLLEMSVLLAACLPAKPIINPTPDESTTDPSNTPAPTPGLTLTASPSMTITSTPTLLPTSTLPPLPSATPTVTHTLPLFIETSFSYDLDRNNIIAFGAYNMEEHPTTSNETWVWDPQGWIQLKPMNSPPPRMAAGLAYDAFRKVAVLFGGVQINYEGKEWRWDVLQDTWFWDGKNWIEQHPSLSPSPRRVYTIVYDDARQLVLLFGGLQDGDLGELPRFLNDTWAWDGATWKEYPSGDLDNGAIPQPSMAYDAEHQKVVLWQFGTGTWLWDGAHWINQHPANSPDLFIEGILGYDEANQRIVFWGLKYREGQQIPETWIWDGINWTHVDTGKNPGPTSVKATTKVMVYDTQNRTLLLVVETGGKYASQRSLWAWIEDGWEMITP